MKKKYYSGVSQSSFVEDCNPCNLAEQATKTLMKNFPQVKKDSSEESKQKRTFVALVQDEPGVLSRISGMISARGFNIDSLIVGKTHVPDMSRLTLVFNDTQKSSEQLRAQLEELVPVWSVFEYTNMRTVDKELCLIKIDLDSCNEELNLRMRRDTNRR